MKDGAAHRHDLSAMRLLSEAALARAVRAAGIAERHERLAGTGPVTMRPFHRRMAEMHRSTESRHRAAAAMQASYAEWIARRAHEQGDGARHSAAFMAAVAEASGARSAAVTLFAGGPGEVVIATSDSLAEAAQDLEYVFGEGPAQAVSKVAGTLYARGSELVSRWPNFGPALRELGVEAVGAARLGAPGSSPLGAVTTYRSDVDTNAVGADPLGAVADALTDTVFLSVHADGEDDLPDHPFFHPLNLRAVVYQAAGMVMNTHDCDAADALALIRARAFVGNKTAVDVARAIVNGRLALP